MGPLFWEHVLEKEFTIQTLLARGSGKQKWLRPFMVSQKIPEQKSFWAVA
jgi:hypothetical protein